MSTVVLDFNDKIIIGEENDFSNSKKERNFDNTHIFHYNCMGYAFGTFNWVHPFVTDDIITEMTMDYDSDEENNYEEISCDKFNELTSFIYETQHIALSKALTIAENIFFNTIFNDKTAIQIAVKNILNAFPTVRQINNLSELNDNEYGIVYATGKEDFHFVKYDQFTGIYTHKMGAWGVNEVDNCDEAFGNKYDSERIYFAKLRI